MADYRLHLGLPRAVEAPVRPGRLGGALGASIALHVAFAVVVVLMLNVQPAVEVYQPPPLDARLVYLEQLGPGGGGGGSPEPAPQPVEIPEPPPPDPAPVVVEPDVPPEPVEPPPLPRLLAPVRTDSAVLLQGAGVSLTAPPAPGGGGRGTGVGPGDGPGVGPGTGGGEGDGPLRPGNGIVNPQPIRQVQPEYTAEAMQAKIQGIVILECVVQSDGRVGQVRVVDSLDTRHGLDRKAIEAARQWTFRPATRDGRPVDIYVTLELAFRLH